MLELDNFEIIETREAEIEYWDCEMNLRIEVIDDHISNWSGPSALESISRGCDISINISCAPHHIIGHVCVCVWCIWYDWCPLSSAEDVFYLIDEVIALGADYWSKWYSIRAKWNTALTIHSIQDWTASTKWHFPTKMKKGIKMRAMRWAGFIGCWQEMGLYAAGNADRWQLDKSFPQLRKSRSSAAQEI